MSASLRIEDLHAFYGLSHVLHGVSLEVAPGEVVLLLGRNGAGKTTLIRSIMGMVPRRRGRIAYGDYEIIGCAPHRISRLGIGLVPEDRRMFARLSVRENLVLGCKPGPSGRGGSRPEWNLVRIFDLFPALVSLQDRKAGTLSGGQQQMVAIARTLMGNATLLLLDEPAEGLAPVIVDALAEQLKTLRTQGLSMLISEQNLGFARALADRAYVIEGGVVRYSGTMTQLAANTAEWSRYIAF